MTDAHSTPLGDEHVRANRRADEPEVVADDELPHVVDRRATVERWPSTDSRAAAQSPRREGPVEPVSRLSDPGSHERPLRLAHPTRSSAITSGSPYSFCASQTNRV